MTLDHDTEKEMTWLQRFGWIALGVLALMLVLSVVTGFADGVFR
jgi:ABC-type lipoprotein release transport system permease subunit